MKSAALSEILTDLYCAGILDTRKVDALNIILEAEAAIRQHFKDFQTKQLNYLLEHGHGGGNWRRLIISMRDKEAI